MTKRKISFDGWVLDRESGDLSREGQRQRLQELPLKVLDLLLASPGALVTREQLIAHLWPKGVVDYDTGLNTAVRKLRVALGDIADAPRYIETIPRRGYRFVGAMDADPPAADTEPEAPAFQEVPNLEAQDPLPETAPIAVSSVSPPMTQARESPPNLRGRLLLGIAAALAVCLGGVYWLSHRAATTPAATALPTALSLPDKSVAVLPFESLSSEPNNEFLATGIAETVLHRLGSLRELTVIARTSSFVFKNRNEDARQIGRALNARYLVQGSVQRAGERLRVQAQLVDATTAKQLWSLNFDRPLTDIFALQDEISNRVAEQLSVSMAPGTMPPNGANTTHLDAYLSYLQGRSLISTGRIADGRNAVQAFDRATQLDPQFAAAYAQESHAITWLGGLLERTSPEDLKRAIALNDKALALSPHLGEAWVQRAGLLLDASDEKDVVEAEKAFKKGLALEPNYGQGFQEYANFLWNLKRMDEALDMLDRARKIDPLTPRNHYLKALMLDVGGKDSPEVETLYLRALQLDPNYHSALVRLGQRYALRGEFARALTMQERAIAAEPEAQWVRGITAGSYLSIGDAAAVDDVLSAEQESNSGMRICLLMLNQDHETALKAAYERYTHGGPLDDLTMPKLCAASEMIRDALVTGQYDRAFRVLEAQYAMQPGMLIDENAERTAFFWGLPFAKILLAKGDSVRANRLLKNILASTEADPSDPVAKPFHFLARAAAFCVLDDREHALAALEEAVRQGIYPIWWIIERHPIFDPLRQEPRYQTLSATMNARLRKQAELVSKMRATHELPQRPAQPARTAT